ncbi:GAF domain-containing protein [Alteromonas flava]|uniref:sensor domain-containing diguanylate cyclase n=1 Tax=Alteromonas flava TaxID=2048003 RepID=UPI000C286FBE|nr:GAF domain-containing protein [Alteromonas flava]
MVLTENIRLKTLQSLSVLDIPPEERFDRITKFASNLLDMPTVLVSLIDENRQWFKSRVGLDVDETPRDISFCTHAIQQDQILIVPDALKDNRFEDNPLVTGEPHIRFYAGQPLIHPNGSKLGTLCLIDQRARNLSTDEQQILRELSTLVEQELIIATSPAIDSETGISTKEAFLELGNISMRYAQQNNIPVSLVFFHIAGHIDEHNEQKLYQELMTRFGSTFRQSMRGSDVVGRYEKYSFVGLCSNTNEDSIERVIERLKTDLTKELAQLGLENRFELLCGAKTAVPSEELNSLLLFAFSALS